MGEQCVERRVRQHADMPKRSRRRGGRGRLTHGRSGRARDLEVQLFEGPELGPDMVAPDLDAVLAALEFVDPEAPWKAVRGSVIPLLPRVRPLPVPIDGLIRTIVPPGIMTGFGMDLGPAVAFVDRHQLQRWDIDVETLTATALDNVRSIAARLDPASIYHGGLDGAPVAVLLSGQGVASALLLVPDCLERLFGPGPSLLLAPMRDVLMALPADVERGLAAWLCAEWEALDPNHLHLGGFRQAGGTLTAVPLEDDIPMA